MRPLFLIAAGLTLGATVACAQNDPDNPNGAPGPSTVTDSNRVDR